jgi:ABC-type transporter Mla maintaining outer membrane lipid asymmetry permease subunit MlaE
VILPRFADVVCLTIAAVLLTVFSVYTGLATAGAQATFVYGLAMLYLATVVIVVQRNACSWGWVWAAMFVGGFAAVIACGSFYPPLYDGYDRVKDPAGLPLFWTSVCMAGSSIIGAIGWVLYNLVESEWDVRDVPQDIC